MIRGRAPATARGAGERTRPIRHPGPDDAAPAESLGTSRGTPLEAMARRLIREAHIRRRLGLAAEPA